MGSRTDGTKLRSKQAIQEIVDTANTATLSSVDITIIKDSKNEKEGCNSIGPSTKMHTPIAVDNHPNSEIINLRNHKVKPTQMLKSSSQNRKRV